MKIAGFAAVATLAVPAYAINPSHWQQFAPGVFIDMANLTIEDEGAISAYVRYVGTQRHATELYDANCKNNTIRVRPQSPQYRSIPVDGGGSIVVADDGFRTVIPDSWSATIETALCGIVAQHAAERTKREHRELCERAKSDDTLRVLLLKDRLTYDEFMCLGGLAGDRRWKECDKAGIAIGATVSTFLQSRDIYLDCENR